MTVPPSAETVRGLRLRPFTAVLRGMRDAERLATSRWRRLPDFLIIGAQKSGTTSLYDYICQHPQVDPALAKGVHFFEEHYARGLAWYRSRFPLRGGGRITGEATPAYLFYPVAPERVAGSLPTAKLIALLRNPVERAYSHYQHERASGVESLPFAAALAAEDGRLRGEEQRVQADENYVSFNLLHYSYRSRGLYARQIQRWLRFIPRGRLLILQAERLFADPAAVVKESFDFLDLPPHRSAGYPVQNARRYQAIDPRVRAELSESFREPNEALYDMIGTRFDWD